MVYVLSYSAVRADDGRYTAVGVDVAFSLYCGWYTV